MGKGDFGRDGIRWLKMLWHFMLCWTGSADWFSDGHVFKAVWKSCQQQSKKRETEWIQPRITIHAHMVLYFSVPGQIYYYSRNKIIFLYVMFILEVLYGYGNMEVQE